MTQPVKQEGMPEATEAEKHDAFEWLRGIALSGNRQAAITLTELSTALNRISKLEKEREGPKDEAGWVITRDLGSPGLGYYDGVKFVPHNQAAIRFARESDAQTTLHYLHAGMVPATDRVEDHLWVAAPKERDELGQTDA